jgi:hypothetical protein
VHRLTKFLMRAIGTGQANLVGNNWFSEICQAQSAKASRENGE